jgi:hypothetical protein
MDQSHAPRHAARASLWSKDPEGIAVPESGDAERALSDAWGKSPGAPKGNRNAWQDGNYSADGVAMRRAIRALLSSARETVSFR